VTPTFRPPSPTDLRGRRHDVISGVSMEDTPPQSPASYTLSSPAYSKSRKYSTDEFDSFLSFAPTPSPATVLSRVADGRFKTENLARSVRTREPLAPLDANSPLDPWMDVHRDGEKAQREFMRVQTPRTAPASAFSVARPDENGARRMDVTAMYLNGLNFLSVDSEDDSEATEDATDVLMHDDL